MQIRSSIRFGRLFGIEIGASWSWLIIVTLLLVLLATSVFPTSNPGLSDGTYAGMALTAAVLFFASLIAHEMGHALQARREGMDIDGITLWVFGGVARFSGMFPSAGAELRIALAGPAVSLVLATVFLGAALASNISSAVDGVVFWVGQINLVLLLFNLLPALPLDGGRVLRAALWSQRGDFSSATRTAAALGRGFGQLMVAGGLLLVLFTGAFGGLWLALIGLFLVGAAEAEGQLATTRRALEDLHARDVMVADPVSVPVDTPLDRFMDDVFLRRRHTAYPVVAGDGLPVGVLSFRHVAKLPREEWSGRTAGDLMVPMRDVVTVSLDEPLEEALTALMQDDLRRALVLDGGQLAGLLSMTDLVRVVEAAGAGAWRPSRTAHVG